MKQVLKVAMKNTKKYIFGILICSLISSFLTMYLMKFIAYVIDGVIMQKSTLPEYITKSFYGEDIKSKLIVLAMYMIIFLIVISISNYIKNMLNTKFKLAKNKNLKRKLLNHTTYLEYKEYAGYGKSQILQRVSSDSNSFVDFINSKYILVVDAIFTLIFSMYEILHINLIVSITIGIIVFIITIMSIIYFKITKKIVHKNIELHEKLISKTMNAIYNPKMIKIFNRQEKEISDFNQVSNEYTKNDKKLIDYLIYYELIGNGLRSIKNPVIFLIGGLFILNGKMNLGELMILITYSNILLEYILQLIYTVEGINDFLVPANRINTFLNLEEEKKRNNDQKIDNISLEFKNVTIKVGSVTVLYGSSFKIENGQTIYLVGDNGSGKSLIIKALLGFIPYEGQILIGGIDIKELDIGTIRKYIGVVFQDPFVFSDTVRNNIDIFENYKELGKIKRVAKICEIDNEIEGFPNKYDEVLGEKGIKLSGGQKQRISIARTLLQNKDIIIFDDVLSKVDSITKEKIKNNLRKYNKNMIAIYITQDLTKIQENEIVFFIDNKKMIIDTQENLIMKNENYNKLISICNNVIGDIDE